MLIRYQLPDKKPMEEIIPERFESYEVKISGYLRDWLRERRFLSMNKLYDQK